MDHTPYVPSIDQKLHWLRLGELIEETLTDYWPTWVAALAVILLASGAGRSSRSGRYAPAMLAVLLWGFQSEVRLLKTWEILHGPPPLQYQLRELLVLALSLMVLTLLFLIGGLLLRRTLQLPMVGVLVIALVLLDWAFSLALSSPWLR